MEVVAIFIVVFVVMIMGLIYSTMVQRKAVKQQEQSIETQNEAVNRQKEFLTLAQESFQLSRQSVANQERMITLLEEIRNGRSH
jgi:hypothetical protein